jgi:hypothetical protein
MKKTITINEEPFNLIKNYCEKNGLKISWLVEKILIQYIDKENEKK